MTMSSSSCLIFSIVWCIHSEVELNLIPFNPKLEKHEDKLGKKKNQNQIHKLANHPNEVQHSRPLTNYATSFDRMNPLK